MLTGVRKMTSDECANKNFGVLIRALGDVIDIGSEVFEDQVMCELDLPHLLAFAKQCCQAEAKAWELRRKGEQLMK